LRAAIESLQQRAEHWNSPRAPSMRFVLYDMHRRVRRIGLCVRRRAGLVAAASAAIALSTTAFFLERGPGADNPQKAFAQDRERPELAPEQELSCSLSFEKGKLTKILLKSSQGECSIDGKHCIPMAGMEGDACCFVVRLMDNEAPLLGLPPEPTIFYLLSHTTDGKRRSMLALPFGKESFCVLRDGGGDLHPCLSREELVSLQPLLTNFPLLTRGSPTPKCPRWDDADRDGRLDRFYAWGGERGIKRINEVVLPQLRKLAGL
ncbi:MAG: hypothetical protein AAB853_03875, partial [Patescibacteria group bacterium]